MAYEIHKVSIRKSLEPRREPYFAAPIARGQYIGFRKIDDTAGTWIARLRDDAGRQQYKSLGYVTDEFDFDKAKAETERWFKSRMEGIIDDVSTVEDACKLYVREKRQDNQPGAAYDAEKRFRRTIYGTRLGKRPLSKVTKAELKDYREALKLAPASADRMFKVLVAALNLAKDRKYVSADRAQEWSGIKPLANGTKRRELYLDLTQRRALLNACEGAHRDLIQAAILTGARPGELLRAKREQFDARTKDMTFTGKTGTRKVPLSAAAVELFSRVAKSKLPTAPLFTTDAGEAFTQHDYDPALKAAAEKAKLPKGVVLYTLRHSFITQAITDGMTTLDVARMTGTSLAMIQKHYGHLVESARDRLALVKML